MRRREKPDMKMVARYIATGGTPPYRWTLESVSAGAFVIDANGIIWGTDNHPSNVDIVVQCRDSGGGSRHLKIRQVWPLDFHRWDLPSG
jgi:hypothetical protein